MWWQGWTAYNKTSWESCPAYGMGTYTGGESSEATDSQKQFLHPDHWIQTPESRECDKYIWSVVRLRLGPVAASLNRLIELLWRTIATSHSTTTTCTHLIVNQRTITLFLWSRMHRWHIPIDQGINITYLCSSVWIHQAPFGPLLSDTFIYQYKPRNLWT